MFALLEIFGRPAFPLAAAAPAGGASDGSWQTPAALLVVALTAFALVYSAWRKRRRPGSGCGSGGEGCGCDAVKKSLKK